MKCERILSEAAHPALGGGGGGGSCRRVPCKVQGVAGGPLPVAHAHEGAQQRLGSRLVAAAAGLCRAEAQPVDGCVIWCAWLRSGGSGGGSQGGAEGGHGSVAGVRENCQRI